MRCDDWSSRLIVFLYLILTSCSAQLSVSQISKPQMADSLWQEVKSCSQIDSEKLSPDSVIWMKVNLKQVDPKHKIVGSYIWPNVILLDDPADALTIKHELLHYLLQTHSDDPNTMHPVEYFIVKCHIIEPQVGG